MTGNNMFSFCILIPPLWHELTNQPLSKFFLRLKLKLGLDGPGLLSSLFRVLRQENHKFMASLSNIETLSQNTK